MTNRTDWELTLLIAQPQALNLGETQDVTRHCVTYILLQDSNGELSLGTIVEPICRQSVCVSILAQEIPSRMSQSRSRLVIVGEDEFNTSASVGKRKAFHT